MAAATARRTDIHRPSAPEFDPESYEFHGVHDLDDDYGLGRQQRAAMIAALLPQGYSFLGSPHGGAQCGHCGAHLRYAALMTHEPTRTILSVGETCLTGRFQALTKAEFARLRKAAALRREATRRAGGKAAAIAALIEAHPELRELTDPESAVVAASDFLTSIADKLRSYGELSDRQIEAATNTIRRFAARERERDTTPPPVTIPAIEGRYELIGRIVKAEARDSFTGGTRLVVTFRDDRGFTVWGTLPDAFRPEGRPLTDLVNRRGSFIATVKRSERDETFGFFSRPTKARRLAG